MLIDFFAIFRQKNQLRPEIKFETGESVSKNNNLFVV